MGQFVEEYKIECYTRFSWGYVYTISKRRHEIWAESVEDLKRKVLSKNLPWDEGKVPKVKPTNTRGTYIGLISHEGSPAQFRLPWCKSNYKRY